MTHCEICNKKVKRRTKCKINQSMLLLCKKCFRICKENLGKKLKFKDFYDQQQY